MPLKSVSLPHLEKERSLLAQNYCYIAGVDEAGRGAWAGPVVAGAVILPLHQPDDLLERLVGLQDSKKLSPKKRDYLFDRIQEIALSYSVGSASSEEVDELNVIGATRCAMRRAIEKLSPPPDYLLIDHLTLPTIKLDQQSFPKADAISLTVAAASVIAKVTRDRWMIQVSQKYPHYAFERHKGYGTAAHRSALAKYGICPLHRRSYKPIQQFSKE